MTSVYRCFISLQDPVKNPPNWSKFPRRLIDCLSSGQLFQIIALVLPPSKGRCGIHGISVDRRAIARRKRPMLLFWPEYLLRPFPVLLHGQVPCYLK